MPTIMDNRSHWGREYEWSLQGDEWSKPWGGAESQWFNSIFPRIHAFIPARTVLEIAPGYGRWTRYLKDHCQQLILVDLSEKCIAMCKESFSSYPHIAYHVNDGRSLSMIADGSIDFAFSFDSLVHAEADVLEAYINELAIKLKSNGVGFIHHSNLGEYRLRRSLKRRIPLNFKLLMTKKLGLNYYHWRAPSVTASLFESYCEKAGLRCFSQELINWRGQLLLDAFSLFTRKGSIWDRPNRVLRNRDFMREADYISKVSRLYASSCFQFENDV